MFKKALLAAAVAFTVGLTACGTPASTPSAAPAGSPTGASTAETPAAPQGGKLTVVTHDSFSVSDELLEKFTADTGYDVTFVTPGDGGSLVNQLVLTKDSPLGDVVYGIDNTFAGRAISEGIIAPYQAKNLPTASAETFKADDSGRLVPIDFGDVCLNADLGWYAERNLPVPTTLDDLLKPQYKDQLVVSNAATSSPGLAFLVATIGAKGADGYLDYWRQLADNGVLVAKDWNEAYAVQFSGSSGNGPRPLVLSYATSPAFEVDDDGVAPTASLLGTCFRQVEYAGVIEGAQNVAGAEAFIEFMLSPEVQADIPEQMYMYPVIRDTALPAEWVAHAPLSDNPLQVPATEISANRDQWIRDWTTVVVG